MSPDDMGTAALEETADHQTDPHRQDQVSFDLTGAGGHGDGEHGGREQALRLYLATCFRESRGWLHVAIGYEPFINDKGKYEHKRFVPGAVRWPDEADDTIALLLTESEEADFWVCPYLMVDVRRAKGEAVSRHIVHSDIDKATFDPEKAEKLAVIGGFAIASGTPGNAHVYVPLSQSVSVDEHEALCVALGHYIGGADPAKHSDNDLLRPPGTYNHKPTVFSGQPPTLVRWLS